MDRRQYHHSSTRRQIPQRLEDAVGSDDIKAAAGLVEEEKGGTVEELSGYMQSLPLSP